AVERPQATLVKDAEGEPFVGIGIQHLPALDQRAVVEYRPGLKFMTPHVEVTKLHVERADVVEPKATFNCRHLLVVESQRGKIQSVALDVDLAHPDDAPGSGEARQVIDR